MRRPGMLRACLVLVAVAAWTPIGAAERPAQATAASTLDADARERIAVQVVDRLYPDSYGKPANAPIPGAGARSADEQALAAKVARLAKGANPFAENGDPFEAALFAVCAVEQGAPPNTLAAEVEQRRRAEHALDVTRTAGSSVLTSHCLVWLGLYALQGGDTVVARRFLSEAAELSERGGASRIAVAARRNLSLTYALEGDIASALREGEAAGRNLDLPRMPADRSAIGATLYGELAGYAAKLDRRKEAAGYARRHAELVEAAGAKPADAAEAYERLAQLLAQLVRDDRAVAPDAAGAFSKAAALRTSARQRDRAIADYTAAGVLLVENATGAAARAPLEKADALARSAGDASLRAGVGYWLGRAYLADAERATGDAARTARDRGIVLMNDALARLKTAPSTASVSEIRATLNLWIGKAMLERKPLDAASLRDVLQHFRAAFGDQLAHGDINEAVACAELVVRSTAALGDVAAAGHAAEDLYDRLAATGRIDPVNAVRALGRQLQDALAETAPAGKLPAPVAAFYDHAAVSLVAAPDGRSAIVEALLVESAAGRDDRAIVGERAEGAYVSLVAAGKREDAYSLASVVSVTWTGHDDALAATWRGRCTELATAEYDKAVADKRTDAAIRAAGRLEALAQARGDAVELKRWRAVRGDLYEQDARRLEGSDTPGLASESWRQAAEASRLSGDIAAARTRYERAVAQADRAQNVDARAAALAGLAGLEREAGDRAAATAAAQRALADCSMLADRETEPAVKARFAARADDMRRLLAELGGASTTP